MSGSRSRSKGRRGETAAKRLLQERDWDILADTAAGISCADLFASRGGITYAVEVKNLEVIHPGKFRKQAIKNTPKSCRWMVLAKIADTSSWLVMRQGERPCVWHERGSK